MISEIVTSDCQAVIRLEACGSRDVNQQVEATVDTGFNGFLTLPSALISRLKLPPAGSALTVLGDGSEVEAPVFEGVVVWYGRRRDLTVLEMDGAPLIGMLLLYGSDLRIQVMEGGMVTIEPLS